MKAPGVPTACDLCGGACCEDMVFPVRGLAPGTQQLLALRCRQVRLVPGVLGFVLPVPCPQLVGGRCNIYDAMPDPCRRFLLGGAACRTVVRRRRPDQAQAILEAMP